MLRTRRPTLVGVPTDPTSGRDQAAEKHCAEMRNNRETPEMRALHSRLASHTRWAHEPDRTAATAPARAGLQARFEREVDPDGVMDPIERWKRVENLRKAYYTRLTYLSLQARLASKRADSD